MVRWDYVHQVLLSGEELLTPLGHRQVRGGLGGKALANVLQLKGEGGEEGGGYKERQWD